MEDVELVPAAVHLVQHRQVRREVGLEFAGVQPDRLVAAGDQRRPGLGFGAGEEGDVVPEPDQGVGEVGDDALGAAVEAGGTAS